MSFFESLVALLLAAVVLLQVARRASAPYPAMLAVAGAGMAFVPGAPTLRIDPEMALALFVAPALLDAAYDFPLWAAKSLWRPLVVMAAGAVLATAVVVGWVGWSMAGLPVAAALVLGAIVAPPDAAAAVAVLGSVALPRRTLGVLRGESLFNDAVALLLFNGALLVQSSGGLTMGAGLQLAVAVPGGLLVGVLFGRFMMRVGRFVGQTLGANVLQFLNTFLVWIIADRLHLSAVLAVVAFAMTMARETQARGSPRMRVHSFAVWASVVFVLNVLAFLLMGIQARVILEHMTPERLRQAERVALAVVAAVVVVRLVWSMTWNRLAARTPALRGRLPPPAPAQGLVVAWCGMRGLVSLATAFALPADFPQRDLVELCAFAVVLATVVLQGLTLAPLIRWLGLDRMEDPARDIRDGRRHIARAGLAHLQAQEGEDLPMLELLRLKAEDEPANAERLEAHRAMALQVVAVQRETLQELFETDAVDTDAYYRLQEEIDWRELSLLPEEERRIEEV